MGSLLRGILYKNSLFSVSIQLFLKARSWETLHCTLVTSLHDSYNMVIFDIA